jgi:hypothetical protein
MLNNSTPVGLGARVSDGWRWTSKCSSSNLSYPPERSSEAPFHPLPGLQTNGHGPTSSRVESLSSLKTRLIFSWVLSSVPSVVFCTIKSISGVSPIHQQGHKESPDIAARAVCVRALAYLLQQYWLLPRYKAPHQFMRTSLGSQKSICLFQ